MAKPRFSAESARNHRGWSWTDISDLIHSLASTEAEVERLRARLKAADDHPAALVEGGVDRIDRCHRAINKLQTIVNKLPKRPDGVVLAPGDEAWIVPGTQWRSGEARCVTNHATRLRIVSVGTDWVCGVLGDGLQPVVPASRLAGTQEAAEAALETEQPRRT